MATNKNVYQTLSWSYVSSRDLQKVSYRACSDDGRWVFTITRYKSQWLVKGQLDGAPQKERKVSTVAKARVWADNVLNG